MRVRRGEVVDGFVGLVVVLVVEGFLDERVWSRLWWVRARVRAPERAMLGVCGVDGGWVDRRCVREVRRVCWRVRKGR